MKLLVFGSTGKTGVAFIKQAVQKEHEITAFAREPLNFPFSHKLVKMERGDVLDLMAIERSMEGQDAVVVLLGIRKNKPSNTLSLGTENILKVAKKLKIRKVVILTSAGIMGNDSGFFFQKIFIPLFLKHIFEDKKRQLKVVEKSDLDWILIRASAIVDSRKKDNVVVSFDTTRSNSITRSDLCEFILKHLTDIQYIRKMPIVSN